MICWQDLKIYNEIFFPSLLILVCVMLALIEMVYDPLSVFLSIHVLLLLTFLFLHFFIFLKCFLTLISKFLFVLPIYILAVLAINLINSRFIFWRNVIFQVGFQKIFDGEFVLQGEYYVVVSEDFVKFIMCSWVVIDFL